MGRFYLTLGNDQALETLAGAGYPHAAHQLAELLAERGDLDALATRADAGNRRAAELLPGLLYRRGDVDGSVKRTAHPQDLVQVHGLLGHQIGHRVHTP